jgi:hypothetical protein
MTSSIQHIGMRKEVAVELGYNDRAGDGFNRTAFGRNKHNRARAYKIKAHKMPGFRVKVT